MFRPQLLRLDQWCPGSGSGARSAKQLLGFPPLGLGEPRETCTSNSSYAGYRRRRLCRQLQHISTALAKHGQNDSSRSRRLRKQKGPWSQLLPATAIGGRPRRKGAQRGSTEARRSLWTPCELLLLVHELVPPEACAYPGRALLTFASRQSLLVHLQYRRALPSRRAAFFLSRTQEL